jgi:hypothetical protein
LAMLWHNSGKEITLREMEWKRKNSKRTVV